MSPPDPKADPMTGGYGSIKADRVSGILAYAPAALIVIMVIILLACVVYETIDANISKDSGTISPSTAVSEDSAAPTTAGSEESAAPSQAADKTIYKSIGIFESMMIDVPETADKVDSEEGICFQVPDGSLRILIVEIPDPGGTYPENVIDYCDQRGIELQSIVDPEGAVNLYAEGSERDDENGSMYIEEEYPSFGENSYRVRVESRTADHEVSSHIIDSLKPAAGK